MTRSPKRGPVGNDPGQFLIDWSASPPLAAVEQKRETPTQDRTGSAPALVQRLKWDFRTTFPSPTPEAIDAGIMSGEDCEPENVRALHAEHAAQLLKSLQDLDAVTDARRRGVDPNTDKAPTTQTGTERLRALDTEPARLEQWWRALIDTYEQGFGTEAADAFANAIRAWHAGIEVIAGDQRSSPPAKAPAPALAAKDSGTFAPQTPRTARIAARLPAPKPLASSVNAGTFGRDESGKPIRPGAHEVREITLQHADRLIDLLDGLHQVESSLSSPVCSDRARLYHVRDTLLGRVNSAVVRYAEDFGQPAAEQLEAYARRQAALDPIIRNDR